MVKKYLRKSNVKKYVRRQTKRGINYIKKRYSGPSGLNKVMSDVKLLKDIINTEKKFTERTISDTNVGQWSGTGSGHYLGDVTPIFNQGTSDNQRLGNSIKLCSHYATLFFRQQANLATDIKVTCILFKHKTDTYNATTMATYASQLFNPNPWYGTAIDMYSGRNVDYYRDFVFLNKKTFIIGKDTTGTVNNYKQIKLSIPKSKLNYHMRFNDAGEIVDGNIYLMVITNYGNISSTTNSPDNQTTSTGVTMRYYGRYYYYDN